MLGQDNLLLPGYSHRNEVSCLLGLQVSRNDQCGLNCREKKSRRGLILWKSYVVPSLAYCTHDTVETTEMRLGKIHRRERFRSPFAASPGLSQTQARFLYQGLKSEVGVLDHSLIPGCVVHTSEVLREVFWADNMYKVQRPM